MKHRILIAEFKHETNSFCPIPADRTAYGERRFLFGQDVTAQFTGIEEEIGAFLDVLGGRPDYALYPCIAFDASPSGPVTADVYDLALQSLTEMLEHDGPFDAILFSLHGAMVAEGHPDGEGDLLEFLRQRIGPDAPIVATLDLHANITPKMAANATALIPYEEYPHTDVYRTGLLAAQLLDEILTQGLSLQSGYQYIPFLLPLFPTDFPEMARFYAMARKYLDDPDVCYVRIGHGFFPADFSGMGMSVVAGVCGSKERAQEIAAELAAHIWEERDTLCRSYPTLDEALTAVAASEAGPIVLADASDNPGAGGVGDTTHLLRGVLQRGLTGGAFATIHDPESVQLCREAGTGATLRLKIGGKSDPAFSGGPLEAEVKVLRLTDGCYYNRDEMCRGALVRLGNCAVVEVGGNHVILSSYRSQSYDLEVFRSCGIQPEAQRFLAVKSAVHYRASYGTVARRMIDLALPGYAVPVPDGLPYRNWTAK